MKNKYFIIIIILFLCFSAANSMLIYHYFNNYLYSSTDGAVHINYFWNFVVNGKFYDSFLGHLPLRHHFDIVGYLFAPVYAFTENYMYILCLKGILVYSSIIPLFLFSRKTLKADNNALYAFIIALIFLFNYYTAYNIRTESGSILMIPLFLWALYFQSLRKIFISVILILLAALTRENIPLVLSLYFGVELFSKMGTGRRKKNIILCLLFFILFILIIKYIQPLFGTPFETDRNKYFEFYSHLGGDYSSVFLYLLKHPISALKLITEAHKISFIIILLLSAGFASVIFSRYFLLIIVFYIQFAISSQQMAFLKESYYFLPIIPFMFLALINFIKHKSNSFKKYFLFTLLIINFYFFVKFPLFDSFIADKSKLYFEPVSKEIIANALNFIDKNHSVMTSLHLRPYCADRNEIHRMHLYNINEDFILLNLSEPEFFIMSPYSDKKLLTEIFLKKIWFYIIKLVNNNSDDDLKYFFYKIKFFEYPVLVLEKTGIVQRNNFFENAEYLKLIESVKLSFENKINYLNKNNSDFLPKYQKNYIPYFGYLRTRGEKQILADELIISNYSFFSENRILKVNINNKLIINVNDEITFIKPQLSELNLKEGLNNLLVEIIGSLFSEIIEIPVFIDTTPPAVEIINTTAATIFKYSDISKVSVKAVSSNEFENLTADFISNESIFYDKLYFTDADSSEEFYSEKYYLHNNGIIEIPTDSKINSIIFADEFDNTTIIPLVKNE